MAARRQAAETESGFEAALDASENSAGRHRQELPVGALRRLPVAVGRGPAALVAVPGRTFGLATICVAATHAADRGCEAIHSRRVRKLHHGHLPTEEDGKKSKSAVNAQRSKDAIRNMYQAIFQNTTIPILEQVVDFTQARHHVLAGNIANLDTPGYRTRDLSVNDFRSQLRKAIEARHRAARIAPQPQAVSPGDLAYLLGSPSSGAEQGKPVAKFPAAAAAGLPSGVGSRAGMARGSLAAQIVEKPKTILYHDDSNVGLEYQVTEMVKNQMEHNLALTIMTSQFRILQAAVSERV